MSSSLDLERDGGGKAWADKYDQSSDEWVCEGHIVVKQLCLWSHNSTLLQGHLMVECLMSIKFVPTDDDIRNGLLVVFGDGLGHSPNLGSDQEGQLQRHGIIGDLHLGMPDD